jgi:ketopantoate hydroxymethyltransferase
MPTMKKSKWKSRKKRDAKNIAKDFSIPVVYEGMTKSGKAKLLVHEDTTGDRVEYKTKYAKNTERNKYIFSMGGALNSYVVKL